MPILKKTVSSYPEVDSFFKSNFPNLYSSIQSIIILEVSEDLWEKFKFVGYGYLVKNSDILPNYTFLEMAANNAKYYNSLPTNEHKRDVNIFRLWKKLEEPKIFVIIRPKSEFYIIHELSHILYNQDERISPYQQLNFNDEYLDSKSEQFSHLNEIKYAKGKGISFEEYFRSNFSDTYNIIKKYEGGDKGVSEELYSLSKMDESDYRKMWEHVI